MSTILAVIILTLCLFITLGVIIPVDLLLSLRLPHWLMLLTVLGLASWLMSDP